MSPQLIQQLIPVVLLVTLITGSSMYVYLQVPRHYYLKLVLIPVSLVCGVLVVGIVAFSLGYAYPSKLPEQFVYLGHHVLIDHGKKQGIEVWVGGSRTRLYVIPWSKPMEEALDKAGSKGKAGGKVTMKYGQQNGKGGNKGNEDDTWESTLSLPSDAPKDQQVQPEAHNYM